MKRKCTDCPEWTQTICRHAFGKYWGDKSTNGEGCNNPLDDVAEAWRKAGWTPAVGTTRQIALPENALQMASGRVLPPRGMVAPPKRPERPQPLSRASGAILPKMPRRPVRPTARPAVSPEIMRQADLFFGRMGNG